MKQQRGMCLDQAVEAKAHHQEEELGKPKHVELQTPAAPREGQSPGSDRREGHRRARRARLPTGGKEEREREKEKEPTTERERERP